MTAGLAGTGPLPSSVQSALKSAINTQGGPNNSATPDFRDHPEHEWYLAIQRIRGSAKEALEHVGEERGPIVKTIISSIRTATEQLMVPGGDPAGVAIATAANLIREVRPDLAQQLDLAGRAPAPGAPVPAGGPQNVQDTGGFEPGGPLASGQPTPPQAGIVPPAPAA